MRAEAASPSTRERGHTQPPQPELGTALPVAETLRRGAGPVGALLGTEADTEGRSPPDFILRGLRPNSRIVAALCFLEGLLKGRGISRDSWPLSGSPLHPLTAPPAAGEGKRRLPPQGAGHPTAPAEDGVASPRSTSLCVAAAGRDPGQEGAAADWVWLWPQGQCLAGYRVLVLDACRLSPLGTQCSVLSAEAARGHLTVMDKCSLGCPQPQQLSNSPFSWLYRCPSALPSPLFPGIIPLRSRLCSESLSQG